MRGGIRLSKLHDYMHVSWKVFLVSIVFLRNCSRQYASTGNRGLEKTEVKADRLRHGKAERKVERRRGKQAARLEPAREDGSF